MGRVRFFSGRIYDNVSNITINSASAFIDTYDGRRFIEALEVEATRNALLYGRKADRIRIESNEPTSIDSLSIKNSAIIEGNARSIYVVGSVLIVGDILSACNGDVMLQDKQTVLQTFKRKASEMCKYNSFENRRKVIKLSGKFNNIHIGNICCATEVWLKNIRIGNILSENSLVFKGNVDSVFATNKIICGEN